MKCVPVNAKVPVRSKYRVFTYLTSMFSVFYLAGINIPWLKRYGLTPSPIYFFTVFGGLFYFYTVIARLKTRKFPRQYFVGLLLFVYLIISQLLLNGALNAVSHVLTSILFLLISLDLLDYLSDADLEKVGFIYILFVTILSTIDTIVRITSPGWFQMAVVTSIFGSKDFYVFKTDSIMFGDSNSVAFMIMVSLVFISSYKKKFCKGFNIVSLAYIILIVELVLTFSRAAIIAYFSLFIIEPMLKLFKKIHTATLFKYLLLLILIVTNLFPELVFILSSYIIPVLSEDGSFLIKFATLREIRKAYASLFIYQKLFGIGLGNAIKTIGVWAHGFVATYLYETGIIGLFLIVLILAGLYSRKNHHSFILTYLLLLTGVSFVPLPIPYFYFTYVLLNIYEKRCNNQDNK